MKKYFLGIITGFIACTMLVSTMAIANVPIKLIVNGREVVSDVPPQIISGRTMIPARPLAEALGADVKWDEANYAVVVTGGVQAGAVPVDLENIPTNPMAGKNALWCEGFTINGNSIETPATFYSPGVHAMGHATPDNFYLEEEILNNLLSGMGLPTVKHKCPSPDVWFNAWYFISLKDIPSIGFTYDSEKRNLNVWDKSKPRPLSEEEKVEEFIPSEWVAEDELGKYGLTVRKDEKTGKYSVKKNNNSLSTPRDFANNYNGKIFNMRAHGEDFRFRMVNGKMYVYKKDIETSDYFKDKI